MKIRIPVFLILSIFLSVFSQFANCENWPVHGDPKGTHYSPLAQINEKNVNSLKLAWRYRTGERARRGEEQFKTGAFQTTPIMVDGLLVFCTPFDRVIALDAETGSERWVFDPSRKPEGSLPDLVKCRGVSYWQEKDDVEDTICKQRVLFGTRDLRIYAIDLHTGKPCPQFGNEGFLRIVDDGDVQGADGLRLGSRPAVINDVVIFGSLIPDFVQGRAANGTVRAFDVRTGKPLWSFNPLPVDSPWTGGANVWSFIAVDTGRDMVFLPTTTPTPDFFGGNRPGDNHYANSLVALRASDGEVIWHYQITHHDLWDYDLPAQPILVELNRDGTIVPAVVQLTKQAMIFVFHRETGEALFPIEEKPVPQGGVPGEKLSKTQPFSTGLPALMKLGMTPEDAWGLTFIDKWLCKRKISALRHDGMYAPPSFEGTLVYPSLAGGANWGGGAWDAEQQMLVVNTSRFPHVIRLMHKRASRSNTPKNFKVKDEYTYPLWGTPYDAGISLLTSPLGIPCSAPPWGALTAIDLSKAEIAWERPLGTLEELAPIPISWEAGTPNAGGPLATAGGIVFIGASLDNRFRAFNTATGEKLWEVKLAAGAQATPVSYMFDGKQYIVIAAGGHPIYGLELGDYLYAFTLEEKNTN